MTTHTGTMRIPCTPMEWKQEGDKAFKAHDFLKARDVCIVPKVSHFESITDMHAKNQSIPPDR
jgi:hypothetical protein